MCDPTFSSWGSGGAVSPPAGPGAEPRRQTHFGKTLLKINLKSGLFSVADYTPNSDPISYVHWLVRRKIGSAVRGCAKLVDIRMANIIIMSCLLTDLQLMDGWPRSDKPVIAWRRLKPQEIHVG